MGDRERVTELLGREPRGAFAVVVRDADGDPIVIRNAPLLDDGTPMPTRYWLVGARQVRDVGRLEAAGGVGAAEAAIDPELLADAHRRYATERDAELPPDHQGPRPSGGVGGTRQGVKCLHAHYAWFLAGGDDPVGRWVAPRISAGHTDDANVHEMSVNGATPTAELEVTIAAERVRVALANGHGVEFDVGPATLSADELAGSDPPLPEQLTNALGAVADRFEDLVLERPEVADVTDVVFTGSDAVALARLESGMTDVELPYRLGRDDAEDVFRTVATETVAQRRHNPGLASDRVESIVATCCVVLAVMRRLHLESAVIT